MIVLEKTVELFTSYGPEAELVVEPNDISFHTIDRETVMVQVRVRNEGKISSKPTFMSLETAPLGTFVPWRPLALVPVPALKPGESRDVSLFAARPHPPTLGRFDRIPPRNLLTAVNASPDEPAPQSGAGFAGVWDLLRSRKPARVEGRAPGGQRPSVAPDLWELFGRKQPHWAGNINVFIGDKAVERHCATALRIYPGRANMAVFLVGGPGTPDAYAFSLAGLNSNWEAALVDVTHANTLLAGATDEPIHDTDWVEARGGLSIMLVVKPPIGCEQGNLEVHVTRKSTRESAKVEFNLDPAAHGPGCYTA